MGEMTPGPLDSAETGATSPSHLLAHVARRTFAKPGATPVSPSMFTHSSILYMTGITGQPRPVEAAARAAGVSEFHFIRRFKRETGMTPGEFLLRYRIVRAMNLLTATAASIASVGRAVGYKDPASFSRAFAKVAGVPPRAYRRGQRPAPPGQVAEPPERYETPPSVTT